MYIDLGEKERKKLRDSVEGLLESVSEEDKIKLPKKTLELLLFETITFRNSIKIKLPVWSGEFLSKLDLSEISFEDVSWQLLECYNLYKKEKENKDENESIADVYCSELKRVLYPSSKKYTDYEKDEYRFFDLLLFQQIEDAVKLGNINYDSTYFVHYYNTNANIDFDSSFEAKNYGCAIVAGCNFNGTDLSKNCVKRIKGIYSNFARTNLNFKKCLFVDCILNGIDLSKFNASLYEIIKPMSDKDRFLRCENIFIDCSLTNTKLNINTAEFLKLKRDGLEEFLELLRDGVFDGCYINGHLKKSRREIEEYYEKQKNIFIDMTLCDINNQIKSCKVKKKTTEKA